MSEPTVSVLIPTKGRKAWCCEAVALALEQTLPPFEVIVLDDAMTDDGHPDRSLALELPRGDGRVRYHWLPVTNLGVKRNLLAHLATGALLALWDDDDWCYQGRLAMQAQRLAGAPSAAWCAIGRRALYYTSDGRVYLRKRHAVGWLDGSVMIWRSAWPRLPEVPFGAVMKALHADPRGLLLQDAAAVCMMLCRIHEHNTTAKAVREGAGWQLLRGVSAAALMSYDREAWASVQEALK